MDDETSLSSSASNEPEDGYGSVEGCTVLVPEGEYVLRYCYYETSKGIDGPKVIVHFAIVENEDYAGTPVERYYNITEVSGTPGRFGNFKASVKGDLVREYKDLYDKHVRLDRISYSFLRDKRVLAKISTVNRDRNRRELSRCNQYSRVSRLIRILPDDG